MKDIPNLGFGKFVFTVMAPEADMGEHDWSVLCRRTAIDQWEFYSNCKCNATVVPAGRNPLSWTVTHNSFDGREGIDFAEEILKNKPTQE